MKQAKKSSTQSVIIVKERRIIRPSHGPFLLSLHNAYPRIPLPKEPISPRLLEPMEPDALTSSGPNRWKNEAGEEFVSFRNSPNDNFVCIRKVGEEKPWVAANVAYGVYAINSTYVQIGQMYPWGINDPLQIEELDKLVGRTGRGFYGVFLAHAILFALEIGKKEIAIVPANEILYLYFSGHLIEPGGAPQALYGMSLGWNHILLKYTL